MKLIVDIQLFVCQNAEQRLKCNLRLILVTCVTKMVGNKDILDRTYDVVHCEQRSLISLPG